MAAKNAMAKLRDAFAEVPFAEHGLRWDACWKENFYPWDGHGPSLALGDILHQRKDLIPPAQHAGEPKGQRRTAFVPGCGRGHDVLLLASWGYDVVGLDYSERALEMAKENQLTKEAEGVYPVMNGMERGSVKWLTGDFFEDAWLNGAGVRTFDLIFDYTFLVALPLEIRSRWAGRIAELLSPSGRLICLEFPVGKPLASSGPPWGVTPKIYEALLAAPGQEISYDKVEVFGEIPAIKPGVSLRRLCLEKLKRTHKIGTNPDGSVQDNISVWGH